MFFRRIKVENLEKLLGTLQEQRFTLNYGDNKAEINLDILLSDYDDGTSFIDYISDFYYVQSVYQKLKNSEDADPVEFFKEFSNSNKSYYKLLSFIKFYYSELESCLQSLNDNGIELEEYCLFAIFEFSLDLYFGNVDKEVSLSRYFYFLEETSNPLHKFIFLVNILEILIWDKLDSPLYYESFDELFEHLSYLLYALTEEVQKLLRRRLSDDKLYLISAPIHDWFGKITRNKSFSIFLNNLTKTQDEKLNCYAVAYGNDFYYYAINHMDGEDRKKLHDTFNSFLENIPAARLTDQVRYFLPNEIDYITYEEFQSLPDKPDGKFNRMFTCCERKIFAKLRTDKPAGKYVNIIVTQAPCEYCSRELRYIKNNKTLTIDINYPELSTINSYDSLARKLFDSCPRHMGGTDI